MRFLNTLLSVALLAGLIPSVAFAADPAPLTDAQKTEIEAVVRDLLIKKEPEIVIKAAQAMQSKMETESATKNQKAVSDNKDRLFNDPTAQVAGNPKGDVTVVEFFDYQCGYCKAVIPMIAKLLEEDKNLKIVYKEYPILGEGSALAAKAALASVKQGKYLKFHEVLMTSKERFTEATIMKLAKDVGLDTEKLKKDMADDTIEKTIRANQALGNLIGAHGTPSFVIGEEVIPGAIPLEQMKEKIANLRKADKK